MIKKFLFLLVCVSSPLLANNVPSSQKNTEIGRYQMLAVGSDIYLLDTATGQMWKSVYKFQIGYEYYESVWQPQIATTPKA